MYLIRKVFRKINNELMVYLPKSKKYWKEDKLIAGLMDVYERAHGYRFDIRNPEMFTEKVQWYKLFFRRKGLENVLDKALFKKYINDRLGEGHIIPMYNYWTSFKQFKKDWDSLPETFVLKSTVSSDGIGVKIIKKKSEVDFKEIAKIVKPWFCEKKTLVNSYCSGYYNATPGVLAEKYMEQMEGQLFDYKFMCFNGKIECIYVVSDQFGPNRRLTFYDLDWEVMDVRYGKSKPEKTEKPKHFEQMIEFAQKLSQDFPFVRVDFFDTDEALYVAELTLYPGGGLYPFHPTEYNRYLGSLFELKTE